MLIGTGSLARACKEWADDDSVLICAAGVSNPLCTNSAEFSREHILLDKVVKKNPEATFVYFSTTSTRDSAYVTHKRAIEGLLKLARPKLLILRLPVVWGSNPYIFPNVFAAAIASRREVVLQETTRELLSTSEFRNQLATFLTNDLTGTFVVRGETVTPRQVYMRIWDAHQ